MNGTLILEKYNKSDLDRCTEKIQKEVLNVTSSFLYIGFLLYECDYEKTYLEKGYSSVVEYAQAELGFKKSSTYNFIKVLLRFGQSKGGFPNYQLTNQYNKYSYSQLVEMLSLSDTQVTCINSDMTIKEIRSFKKSDCPDELVSSVITFQTSGKDTCNYYCPECGFSVRSSGKVDIWCSCSDIPMIQN